MNATIVAARENARKARRAARDALASLRSQISDLEHTPGVCTTLAEAYEQSALEGGAHAFSNPWSGSDSPESVFLDAAACTRIAESYRKQAAEALETRTRLEALLPHAIEAERAAAAAEQRARGLLDRSRSAPVHVHVEA